jgi:hypothetical protein
VRAFQSKPEVRNTAAGWLALAFGVIVASAFCAVIIALGVDFLGIVAFSFLAPTIFLNNVLVSFVLAPLLIPLLEKRIHQMRLSYSQIMDPGDISPPLFRQAGAVIALGAVLVVAAVAFGLLPVPGVDLKMFELISSIVLPFIALLFL